VPVRDKEREEEICISNGNWEIEVIKPVRQTASEHRNKPNYPKRSKNPRECHLSSTHLLRMKTCFNKELNLTNLSEDIASHLLFHCLATKLFTRQCHCYITWCFSDRASWIDYILITNLMHWLLFIYKILFSSTCFEPQVLIFRRIQLYTCSIWYCHSLWEFLGGLSVHSLSENWM